MVNIYRRGAVWTYTRPQTSQCITYGTHPCVIVSDEDFMAISGSVVVVPCTSELIKGTTKEFALNLKEKSYLMPLQITTISKQELNSFIGQLDDEEIAKVNSIMSMSLGLADCSSLSEVIRFESDREKDKREDKDDTVDSGTIEKTEQTERPRRKVYYSDGHPHRSRSYTFPSNRRTPSSHRS